jgi:hypothetical protein
MVRNLRDVYNVSSTYQYVDDEESARSDSSEELDVEELNKGVVIIESLSRNGIISAEEGDRRKYLIQAYFEYNAADIQLESVQTSCWEMCFHGVHQCWAQLWRWIYYTEQVD